MSGNKKLFATEFMSLDGVFEAPGPDGAGFVYEGWSFPYMSDEFGKFKLAELKATDELLLGRVTYDGFATAWPGRTDEMGFADKFNSMPKHVVSKTLKKADWQNSHIIKGDVVEAVKKLKEGKGTIAVHGSGSVVRLLLEHQLLDELTLMVYPIVLGTGKRLFADLKKTGLELVSAKPIANGIVVLTYKPAK
jgi:dihydrofolate reductase